MNSRIHLTTSPALVMLALACCGPSLAAPTADLRALSAQANWTVNTDDATKTYEDRFNNGNAQTGATYTGGYVVPANLYTVSGQTTGAETTPGDFTIRGQAVGQFQFSQANAAPATPLNVNGVLYDTQSHFLRMNGPTLNSTPDTLFRRDNTNFAVSAAWDFSTPDPGMRYGMRLTDANIGDDGFDDLISLDVVNSVSGPRLELRRVAGSELTGARTITDVESRSFLDGVFSGYTLADVNVISMHMYWFKNTNQVSTEVELLRIANGGGTIDKVGQIDFNNRYTIFNGVDGFTRFQVGAQWNTLVTAPVPEPSTYALMVAGLAVIGCCARRRSRA